MSRSERIGPKPDGKYPERIRELRAHFGLTQQALAASLGVSFATINRWENGQTTPSQLSWNRLREFALQIADQHTPYDKKTRKNEKATLDFTANPEVVKLLAEGERLSYGHLMNPAFATEISSIDPLPHQRIAVYDYMLRQPRLRFLLADDAGAGKTIMTGLYLREMLSRRLLQRILIITPAGLLGNWRRELLTLFNLPFTIVSGSDTRDRNPFLGDNSNNVIISIDTLVTPRVFSCLKEAATSPYDIAIFDEAHKLSADRGTDMRVIRRKRYCLAEALAGVNDLNEDWKLGWSVQHLLLLTATPHMGKDYPYYALWRLLEPDGLSTPAVFNRYSPEQRRRHFIRRTKEEMLHLDGAPLFPKRITDTHAYKLTQGEISEQTLYDETTDYLKYVYNRAKLLNREAARLAMAVFQRRLASSTYALMRSFERRIEKLDRLIEDVQDGKLTIEQLLMFQKRIREDEDVLDSKAADEEFEIDGREENEVAEDRLLSGVYAASLADLLAEKGQVKDLLALAEKVYDLALESKFEKLREILTDPKFSGEKFIVFTEHRDTLNFLVKRLNGLGFTGQIAQIHGGMHYTDREKEVEHFRKQASEGGARLLICTDAAGEGINLQFCRIMINYDIPWNPARLEQRMGRIHRYGQKHDPVLILNLVSSSTREGKVLGTLLRKLETIRKELKSDKVFDCIGRIFSDVSIKKYMELAITADPDDVARELDGRLTKEQVEALAEREKSLYGTNGDVAKELPRLRETLDREIYFRLLPGYVRHYLQRAAPLVDIKIDGDMDKFFTMRPVKPGAMDEILPSLEIYPETVRNALSVSRPPDRDEAVWLHPGEPVFEEIRRLVSNRLSEQGRRGAIFIDPSSEHPYLFHLALLSVVRQTDSDIPELAREDVLETKLVGLRQYDDGKISLCPVEHLLLLKGGRGLPSSAQNLAVSAQEKIQRAQLFLTEGPVREIALRHKQRLLENLPEREIFIKKGFDFQEAEFATARVKQSEKARAGNRKALQALEEIKQRQRNLGSRRKAVLEAARKEIELVAPAPVVFIAHALVVPSSDPAEIERHRATVEMVAMEIAQAFEEAAGADVAYVHTPELARGAGLPDNPGFDLLSTRSGNCRRAIEVKGRAGTGEVEVSSNEWARACNMREDYWLYVVYECATPSPRLVRVRDPFGALLAKAKGSVLIGVKQVMEAAEVL
ncbi:MAG: DUF3883 domain-containing protein [Candidatus Abyssobacteria bacterium SURF_5]|uniref:DUF3883 domain-containing protein n=1 Tax=Abyssobacteria bacterium (strain SURF_5) TaxID=2093360 RepID=A0A3A4NQP9_ABYX5|nr:MAG: DUF3883 domain-containing protein [Candidatus Abyssubacteria bacterium SURF_5]